MNDYLIDGFTDELEKISQGFMDEVMKTVMKNKINEDISRKIKTGILPKIYKGRAYFGNGELMVSQPNKLNRPSL